MFAMVVNAPISNLMIKKENTRMNRQVEDILTIARLDKKEFEFRWEPIDVHELIEAAVPAILVGRWVVLDQHQAPADENLRPRGDLPDVDKNAAAKAELESLGATVITLEVDVTDLT